MAVKYKIPLLLIALLLALAGLFAGLRAAGLWPPARPIEIAGTSLVRKPIVARYFLPLPDRRQALFQGKILEPQEDPSDFNLTGWSIFSIDIKSKKVTRLFSLDPIASNQWHWLDDGNKIVGKLMPAGTSEPYRQYTSEFGYVSFISHIMLLDLKTMGLGIIEGDEEICDYLPLVDNSHRHIAFLRLNAPSPAGDMPKDPEAFHEWLTRPGYEPANNSIWVADSSGAAPKHIADAARPCGWSADGRALFFISDLKPYEQGGIHSTGNLYRKNLDTSHTAQLTTTADTAAAWPLWQKGQLLFLRKDSETGQPSLWLMPEAGGSPRLLHKAKDNSLPLFYETHSRQLLTLQPSPDGKFALFAGDWDLLFNPSPIYLMDLSTGKISELIENTSLWHDPTWLPDSRTIILSKYSYDTGDEIYTLDLKTRKLKKIW